MQTLAPTSIAEPDDTASVIVVIVVIDDTAIRQVQDTFFPLRTGGLAVFPRRPNDRMTFPAGRRMLARQMRLERHPATRPLAAGESKETRGGRLRARGEVGLQDALIATFRTAMGALSRQLVGQSLHGGVIRKMGADLATSRAFLAAAGNSRIRSIVVGHGGERGDALLAENLGATRSADGARHRVETDAAGERFGGDGHDCLRERFPDGLVETMERLKKKEMNCGRLQSYRKITTS